MYFKNNVDATEQIALHCLEADVSKFVFASTAAVYGDAGFASIDESTPCQPISPYGSSKLAAENVLFQYSRKANLSPIVLRLFNAAGENRTVSDEAHLSTTSGLIHLACRAALGVSSGLDLYGTDFPTPDGNAVRDFIHVDDIASAVIAALELPDQSSLFVVGSGIATSARQVVWALTEMGYDFPVTNAQGREGEIVHSLSNPSLAKKALGWEARKSTLPSLLDTTLQVERLRLLHCGDGSMAGD